jgi:hypothetical protein
MPHSSHSSLRSRELFLSGGLQTFGDAATADGFTFSHYPDPLCRPHAPAGVGTARELTDFPQTASSSGSRRNPTEPQSLEILCLERL